MDELVVWLRAQLDADERIARRAGDSFRQIGETGVIVATEGDRAEECASANWAGVAEHIVRHDPARVLREIDAKRQLLKDLLSEPHVEVEDPWYSCAVVARQDRNRFGRPCDCGREDRLLWRLRLLALSYAASSGYRAEWRP